MIVAVHQPQYLPWLGYFDKMAKADIFCYLDNVQYKKNEWQNRNRIKTAQGWQWLTVPGEDRPGSHQPEYGLGEKAFEGDQHQLRAGTFFQPLHGIDPPGNIIRSR